MRRSFAGDALVLWLTSISSTPPQPWTSCCSSPRSMMDHAERQRRRDNGRVDGRRMSRSRPILTPSDDRQTRPHARTCRANDRESTTVLYCVSLPFHCGTNDRTPKKTIHVFTLLNMNKQNSLSPAIARLDRRRRRCLLRHRRQTFAETCPAPPRRPRPPPPMSDAMFYILAPWNAKPHRRKRSNRTQWRPGQMSCSRQTCNSNR
jgi:hypothetical protein